MTNIYSTDQEQTEAIKDWVKKYGMSIVIGVVVALIGSYGYRYWRQHQLIMAERAAVVYEQMLGSAARNQPVQLQQFADQLLTEYHRTPYADLAGLLLAKEAVNNGKYPVAVEKLQWVIAHTHDNGLRQIARLRVARVLLFQGQTTDALAALKTVDDQRFQPAIDEVRGDILVAQNNKAAARAAYQAALAAMPASAMNRMWLQMKFDELSESVGS